MSLALITEVNLDDVLNMLALMDSFEPISKDNLREGLELITEGSGQWDINTLIGQIKERSSVLK